MRMIGKKEIEDMAVGAAVIATGGGGDPYVGKLMALQAVEKYGEVKMLTVDEVPNDALIVVSCMIGAPTVLVEKIPSGTEAALACERMEELLGKEFYAVCPLEAGGINSMLPLTLAASKGLPVIDGDGMGRAFPETQMVTWSLYGISADPSTIADEKGNTAVVNAIDNAWAEKILRAITIREGGSCFMATYVMTGEQLKKYTIHGTSTLCQTVGAAIREARKNRTNPVQAVIGTLGAYELFRGKVSDLARRTERGWTMGTAHLDGLDDYKGKTLLINFQNENLMARMDGEVLCSTPDLITLLDIETGLPITTENVKFGSRAVVIGIPCSHHWRTPKGLEVAGPTYFGYPEVEYIPVEERVAAQKARKAVK